MGYTKVRNYTALELLGKAKSLPSFQYIPKDYWLQGVRSNEDTFNIFDDKIYVWKGEKCVGVLTGTTNTGGYGLKNFKKWSKRGAAVIKSEEWYYDVWSRGKHKRKVEALIQTGAFKVIRDNNFNEKSGDISEWSWETGRGLNFHPNTYNLLNRVKRWIIGKWSVGCIVINDILGYVSFLNKSKPQKKFTFLLIDEF